MNGSLNANPKLTQVTSSAISHSPRVTRKRISDAPRLPRSHCRKTATPASATKVGAQRCVIQRVANRAGVVWARSVGEMGLRLKKSRVWSSTIRTMTRPRSLSMISRRVWGADCGSVSGSARGKSSMDVPWARSALRAFPSYSHA